MSNIYLDELTNQKKKLAETLNKKGVTATASEKFNTLVPKVKNIVALKGEEKTVDNITTYNDTPQSVVQVKYPRAKNLIPFPYLYNSRTNNGITYTANYDGTITANGTFEDKTISSYITLTSTPTEIKTFLKLPLGNQYTISGSPVVEGVNSQIRYCNLSNGAQLDAAQSDNGTPKTFTTVTDVQKTGVQISLKSNGTVTTVNNVVFKPQIEVGSVATTFEAESYNDKKIDVQLQSKNLIPYPYTTSGTITANGGTFIINDDGSITASGTPTESVGTALVPKTEITDRTNKKYILSLNGTSTNILLRLFLYENIETTESVGAISVSSTLPSSQPFSFADYPTANYYAIIISRQNNDVEMSGTTYPQLEYGDAATPYTPYITDFSNKKICACGENLIDGSLWKEPTTQYGITVQYLEDEDCFLLNGTATATENVAAKTLPVPIPIDKNTRMFGNIYYISGNVEKNAGSYAVFYLKSSKANVYSTNNFQNNNSYQNKEKPDNIQDITLAMFSITKGYTFTNYKVRIFIGIDNSLAAWEQKIIPYEPYEGQVYASNSQGIISNIPSHYPIKTLYSETGTTITAKGGAYKEILPSTGKNGITKVWQEVVGSDIDENIKPENIKKGITILGVTGNME